MSSEGPATQRANGEPLTHVSSPIQELFVESVDEVYRYVYRMCLDCAQAEDVVQDVFLAALKEKNEAQITAGWLIRSARNRLIDIIRRGTNGERKLRLLIDGRGHDQIDAAEEAIDRVRAQRAMASLAPNHRIILMLHHIDGLTVPELARSTGRSDRGIESLLTRARKALRDQLEKTR